MNADDLSERDREHFDKLCDDRGYNSGDSDGYRIPGPDDVTPREPGDPDEDSAAIRYSLLELGGPVDVAPLDRVAIERSKDARITGLERELERTREEFRAYTGSLFASAPLLAMDDLDGHGPTRCGTQVVVSMRTKSVKCRACGVELEPMDVLRAYAAGERRFVQHVDSLVQKQRDLETECRKLNELKNSLRSAVRKKGIDPDVAMRSEQQGIEALKAQRAQLKTEIDRMTQYLLRLRKADPKARK